jgi:DNA-directed RNA polymerase specialized sigma24 family protein
MGDPRLPPKSARGFPTTSWTLLSMVQAGGSQSQDALGVLLARYGEPIKAYLQTALRVAPDDAGDMAHDFFIEKILRGRLMVQYDRTKGSFRPFLKRALRNYVISKKREEQALRRRPDAGLDHPDQNTAGWDVVGAAAATAPESAFHAAWVRRLLDHALREVRVQCEREDLMQHYAVFEGRYLTDDPPPKWSDLAAPFGWNEKQACNRAGVIALRFRRVLTDLVCEEVGSERLAREELEALLALL